MPLTLGLVLSVVGCVPKTQYDDQQSRLDEAQAKLKAFENNTAECDKDTFMQLREQAQSMELLNQELLSRNTELSKEIARLKVSDSQSRAEDLTCSRRMESQAREFEEKLSRTQATYEDLVRDLKLQVEQLKSESHAKPKANPQKPATHTPKSVKN